MIHLSSPLQNHHFNCSILSSIHFHLMIIIFHVGYSKRGFLSYFHDFSLNCDSSIIRFFHFFFYLKILIFLSIPIQILLQNNFGFNHMILLSLFYLFLNVFFNLQMSTFINNKKIYFLIKKLRFLKKIFIFRYL